MGFLICEKAREGIEIKTMRLIDDFETAEAIVLKTYQGKWFMYELSKEKAPRLRLTVDFRHSPVGQPQIKRYK